MTPKGEQLTIEGEVELLTTYLQGELNQGYETGVVIEKEASEEKLRSEGGWRVRMIFVEKGHVCFYRDGEKKPFLQLQNGQHNLVGIHQNRLTMKGGGTTDEQMVLGLELSFLERHLPAPAYFYKAMERDGFFSLSAVNMYLTAEMNTILQTIRSSAHKGFCGDLFLESKAMELLALQLSQFSDPDIIAYHEPVSQQEAAKMYEVRDILLRDEVAHLSLRTLAHMVGTNEYHLKKRFKMVFGTTVYGYLHAYKMEQAKQLLIAGDLNISQVSDKMGYKHATHFTKAFKKRFGFLPNKIRMIGLFIQGGWIETAVNNALY